MPGFCWGGEKRLVKYCFWEGIFTKKLPKTAVFATKFIRIFPVWKSLGIAWDAHFARVLVDALLALGM